MYAYVVCMEYRQETKKKVVSAPPPKPSKLKRFFISIRETLKEREKESDYNSQFHLISGYPRETAPPYFF